MLRIDPWNVLFIVINLLVLYLFMKLFLFKPIKSVIDKREAMIRESLNQAEDSKLKANELLEKRQKELSGVMAESSELMEKAKTNAQNEYNRIISGANEEAGTILKQARAQAKSEHDSAIAGAKGEIAELAMAAAEKILSGSAGEQLDKSIYNDFLSEKGENK